MSEEPTNNISMRLAKPSEEDIDGQIAVAFLLEHLFDRGIEEASLGWISEAERADIPDPPKWMSVLRWKSAKQCGLYDDPERTYDIEATMTAAYEAFGGGLMRCAWSLAPLIEAVCNPLLDHLEFKPEIGAALAAVEAKPRSPMDRNYLQEMATLLTAKLPDNHGFILFSFPYGDQPEGRLNYVASCERADAINTLKEWLLNCSAAEDWMKHLE